MLARNAEALYWIGRYVERADDTARILDVTVHQLLEDSSVDPDHTSRVLLQVLGIEEPDDTLDLWSLTDVVAFRRNTLGGGSSIVDAITAARENARSAREVTSWIGRPFPLRRVTEASLLSPTMRRSHAALACPSNATCPG